MSNNTKEIWVFGDIQGCANALKHLLARPELNKPNIELWFAGDLVNRGPDSLGALRLIMSLGDRARAILGNHDLHLLAVAAGVRKQGKSDTINDILDAPDADDLIDWLRNRPLLIRAHQHVLVHAGILPAWTIDQAEALAQEIEQALRGPNWQRAMADLYGEKPLKWDDSLVGPQRMRIIVNALTRMRFCNETDGSLDFQQKGKPKSINGLRPWFEIPGQRNLDETIVFGHWSALGLKIRPDVICLDTGCIWGRSLTALCLHDHRIIQHDCSQCK